VHLAAGELGAATTTAGHPRSLGVAHQIPAKLGLRPEARISLAAGVAQDQSPETSEGYGCGRFGMRGRLRVPAASG